MPGLKRKLFIFFYRSELSNVSVIAPITYIIKVLSCI